MNLSALSLNNVSLSSIKNNFNKSTNIISFGSSLDKIELSNVQTSSFDENVNFEQQQAIINGVNTIANSAANGLNSNETKLLGTGANGSVYKLDNIKGFEQGLVVKISHTKDKNPVTGEKQRVNCSFDYEKDILKSVSGIDSKSQNYVADFVLKDGRYVLVSTLVSGKNPDVQERPLTKKSLAQLLDIFEKLDEQGVLHRDLKKENIIIDKDNNAGLIDFGEAIKFDLKALKDNSDNNNFPEILPPTNLRSFEDTLLFPYMEELKKSNPAEAKQLFRDYLTLKAPICERRADSIKEYLKSNNLPEELGEKLFKMENYQRLLSKMLKSPDEDVITAEMLQCEITYNSELAYKNEILLLNPLANVTFKMNSLIAAKRLEAYTLQQINKPNTLEKREYFMTQNDIAKYRLSKTSSWLNGLVGWFTECMTTDIQNVPDYKQDLIDQCVNGQNLQDFEIPDVTEIKAKI